MTPLKDIPRIARDGANVGGMGYTLKWAQKERMKRGQTIYERDKQVDEYKYSKGKFV